MIVIAVLLAICISIVWWHDTRTAPQDQSLLREDENLRQVELNDVEKDIKSSQSQVKGRN